jgi:hypothetical protein
MIVALFAVALAAPLVPLQGELFDAAGNPLEGTVPLVVRIYGGDPAAPTALWTEAASVAVQSGHFSISLGASGALPDEALQADDARWLTVAVSGGLESAMTPIGFAPRAVYASHAAESDAVDLAWLSARLGEVIDPLSAALAAVEGAVADLAVEVDGLADGLSNVEGDLSALQGDLSTTQADLSSVSSDLATVSGQVGALTAGGGSASVSQDYDLLTLGLASAAQGSWGSTPLISGRVDGFATDSLSGVAGSSGLIYDAGGRRYFGGGITAATTQSNGTSNWNFNAGLWTFDASGGATQPSGTWNLGAWRTNAELVGDFDVEFTQANVSGNGGEPGTYGPSWQFGVSTASLSAADYGNSPFVVNASKSWYIAHNGVGANRTVALYRGNGLVGASTRTITAGDVWSVSRVGMSLYAKHNGAVIGTFSTAFPTTPAWVLIGHGGNSVEPTFRYDNLRWTTYAPGASVMTLVGAPLSPAPAASPSEVRLGVLWSPGTSGATVATDFSAEVTKNGGGTWTTASMTDTGAVIGGHRLLVGNVGLSGTGTAVQYRLRALNNKTQSVRAVGLLAR